MADLTQRIREAKAEIRSAKGEVTALTIELQKLQQQAEDGIKIDPKDIEKTEQALAVAQERVGKFNDALGDSADRLKVLSTGKGFEQLSAGLGDFATKLKNLDFEGAKKSSQELVNINKKITFKGAVSSLKDLTGSFANLGKVLLTNPIFLLATVVTTIIANFDKLKAAGGLVGKVFGAIGDTIDFVVEQFKTLLDALGLTEFKQQEVTENNIKNLEKESSVRTEAYDRQIAEAEAAGKSTVELEIEKQKYIIETNKALIDQIKAQAGTKALTDEQREQIEELEKATLDAESSITQIQNSEQKKREDAAKEEADKRREAARQAAEKIKENEKQVTAFLANEKEQRFQATLNETDRAIRQTELEYAEKIKLAGNNKTLIKQLEESLALETQAIRDAANKKEQEKRLAKEAETQKLLLEIRNNALDEIEAAQEEIFQLGLTNQQRELQTVQDEYFQKIEFAKQNGLDTLALEAELRRQQTEINDKYREEEKAKEEKAFQEKRARQKATVDTVAQSLAFLTAINEGFSAKDEASRRKAFERDKKLKIAQALINTYSSAVAAFDAASKSPVTTVFPGFPFVQAGLAVAAGLANVNTIRKQTFEGGSSGGANAGQPNTGAFGSAGVAPTAATPAFSLFGNNNNANNITTGQPREAQAGPMTINVQVSETEITSTQNFVRNVRESSTL